MSCEMLASSRTKVVQMWCRSVRPKIGCSRKHVPPDHRPKASPITAPECHLSAEPERGRSPGQRGMGGPVAEHCWLGTARRQVRQKSVGVVSKQSVGRAVPHAGCIP